MNERKVVQGRDEAQRHKKDSGIALQIIFTQVILVADSMCIVLQLDKQSL